MDTALYKLITYEEIKDVLTNGVRIKPGDIVINNLTVLLAGSLYKYLWVLSCVAVALSREHLKKNKKKRHLKLFNEVDRSQLNIVFFNLPQELYNKFDISMEDVEKNELSEEAICFVVQTFFDELIKHIDLKVKQIHPTLGCII